MDVSGVPIFAQKYQPGNFPGPYQGAVVMSSVFSLPNPAGNPIFNNKDTLTPDQYQGFVNSSKIEINRINDVIIGINADIIRLNTEITRIEAINSKEKTFEDDKEKAESKLFWMKFYPSIFVINSKLFNFLKITNVFCKIFPSIRTTIDDYRITETNLAAANTNLQEYTPDKKQQRLDALTGLEKQKTSSETRKKTFHQSLEVINYNLKIANAKLRRNESLSVVERLFNTGEYDKLPVLMREKPLNSFVHATEMTQPIMKGTIQGHRFVAFRIKPTDAKKNKSYYALTLFEHFDPKDGTSKWGLHTEGQGYNLETSWFSFDCRYFKDENSLGNLALVNHLKTLISKNIVSLNGDFLILQPPSNAANSREGHQLNPVKVKLAIENPPADASV